MKKNNSLTAKQVLGAKGEEEASKFLGDKGYRIIERNFRKPWGELDIVAIAPDKTLVFVEVKTTNGRFAPEEQMTGKKMRNFKTVASLYAGANNRLIDDKKGFRLDLLALTETDNGCNIVHYENVI